MAEISNGNGTCKTLLRVTEEQRKPLTYSFKKVKALGSRKLRNPSLDSYRKSLVFITVVIKFAFHATLLPRGTCMMIQTTKNLLNMMRNLSYPSEFLPSEIKLIRQTF